MRRTMLTLLLALAPAVAVAQQTPTSEAQLPRDVRRLVIDRWNGANEFRAVDRADIGESAEVRGNVSVLRGPLILAGHVTGSVLVINGDLLLRPSSRIDGDLIVVGGDVEGRSSARVGGTTLIYRQPLAYREEGDRIVGINDDGTTQDESWWRRLERQREGNWSEAFRVVQAGAYNRVEGLPVQVGPAVQRLTPWGSVRFDAAGIIRTGSTFATDQADVGHYIRSEVRVGRERGIGVGGTVFDEVDPIESWQLSDLETALAAFIARRDYRDYYERHGAMGYLTLYGTQSLSLSGGFGQQRWSSRSLKNPFTLFNADRNWRPNPSIDEGLFHIGDLTLRFDTRSDPDNPWSGWYVNADVEHGRGRITEPGLASTGMFLPNELNDYTRGLFDLRRYNRLGPSAQLNMRLLLGGWIGGDRLPLERRLSVDGPGAMPGFGFRSTHAGIDVGDCNAGLAVPGTPTECDRVALAQAEYRGVVKLGFIGRLWEGFPRYYRAARGDINWVLFADAGRGWIVGQPTVDGLTYGSGTLPPLSTFRTDMGVGIDIAGIGIYGAKALSSPSEPANFFVRLRHRF